MKITQIDNACCIYESQGFKLLADPWLTDGAFEGSWYHYPPLLTTFDDVKDVDALYISHLHPDHYDETILKKFVDKNPAIPVLVLDREPNFLSKKLSNLGFTNLYLSKSGERTTIGPLEVTLYEPFTKHPFDDSVLGNFIDSAMVIQGDGKLVLNANDNTPDAESAKMLFDKHGKFDVVQLKDSLASCYPSCFINLSDDQKLFESKRLINRQLSAMCEVADILKAEWFQPFAGDYMLGGTKVCKNKYLGVSAKQHSAKFIAAKGIKPLLLSESSWLNINSNELKSSYQTSPEPFEKWSERVSQIKYVYQNDPEPGVVELRERVFTARDNLWKMQEKFNFKPNYRITIELSNGAMYTFNLRDLKEQRYSFANYDIKTAPSPFREEFDLACYMDPRLLMRIANRDMHWNSAEVGCHIDFDRKGPYNPDVHMIMSFFHA